MANSIRANAASARDEFAAPIAYSVNFAEELEAAFDAVLMGDTPQPKTAPSARGEAFSIDEHRRDGERPSDRTDQLTSSSKTDHTYPPPSNLEQPADMDAPLGGALDDWESECLRVRDPNEEPYVAPSHSTEKPGYLGSVSRRAGYHQPAAHKPDGRGKPSRNVAIAATVLNGLVVLSVISLTAMLVPGSLPTANGGDRSTGSALPAGAAHQEPAEKGWAVAKDDRESEPPTAAEQSAAGLVDSNLAGIEEPNESSAPKRSSVAAGRGATSLPPVDNASAASAAHPVAASSSILQKRPPADQFASPDSAFPDRLVEAPAWAAEGRRPMQAPNASSQSADTGVRLIKFGEEPVATSDSTEPDRPRTAATEPSDDGGLPAGIDPQPADGPPDGLALSDTGGASAFAHVDRIDGQFSVGEIAPAEPDIASAGAEVTPEVTRSAPVRVTVNMRAEPSLDAPIITVLSEGTEVGVIGCDGWCEVVFADKRGWIYGSLISDGFADSNSGAVTSSGVAGGGGSGGAGTASVDVGDLPASSENAPGSYTSAAAQSAGETATASNLPIAAGTPLISADGAPIGMVRDITTDATGQTFVVVDLEGELSTAVPSIRLRIEHVLAADRHAQLKFTRAQVVNSLPTSN
jgi:hypothetical protein